MHMFTKNRRRFVPALSVVVMVVGVGSALAGDQAKPDGKEVEKKKLSIGDAAPELKLEELLQVPAKTEITWAALRGKVVLIEFWATWCSPCVEAFPHLNEMVDKLGSDKDFVFLSITDEKRDVVEPFLKKKPLKTWIGLDADRSASDAYGVFGIPHTVIVDRQGKIAGITFPEAVTVDVLRKVAKGEKVDLPGMDSMMPESMDDVARMMMMSTTIGDKRGVIDRLAGTWTVEQTVWPMGSMGPQFKATSEVVRTWAAGGHALEVRSAMKTNPVVEGFGAVGYDLEKEEYYIHEYSPVDPSPTLWTGKWDAEKATFVLTNTFEIDMGPGGPAGKPIEAEMRMTIELDDKDTYSTEIVMDFSAAADAMGDGMMAGMGVETLSRSVARRTKSAAP